MAAYLGGTDDWSLLEHQGQVGAMVKTWVASELPKLISILGQRLQLYFLQPRQGMKWTSCSRAGTSWQGSSNDRWKNRCQAYALDK
jgi:hypothetical protein